MSQDNIKQWFISVSFNYVPFFQVAKNRIHSQSDKAIVLVAVSEGHVNDNALFKGQSDPVMFSADCKCTVKNNITVEVDAKQKTR